MGAQSDLKDDLQESLESFPATPVDAADGWAEAIAVHVAKGIGPQFVPATPASIMAGKSSLASSIALAFQSGTAPGAGAAAGNAIVQFYSGLLFLGYTPGSVTLISGAASLNSSMAAAFSENMLNAVSVSDAAARFADAIHTCAQSVIVTHEAPAYVVGPLVFV